MSIKEKMEELLKEAGEEGYRQGYEQGYEYGKGVAVKGLMEWYMGLVEQMKKGVPIIMAGSGSEEPEEVPAAPPPPPPVPKPVVAPPPTKGRKSRDVGAGSAPEPDSIEPEPTKPAPKPPVRKVVDPETAKKIDEQVSKLAGGGPRFGEDGKPTK